MKPCRSRRCEGRADPFGLLVVAVLLAVSFTILVQAQASSSIDFTWPTALEVWPLGDRS